MGKRSKKHRVADVPVTATNEATRAKDRRQSFQVLAGIGAAILVVGGVIWFARALSGNRVTMGLCAPESANAPGVMAIHRTIEYGRTPNMELLRASRTEPSTAYV